MNEPRPQIDDSAFVAENATVLGQVEVGADCSVWYGAVIRGDTTRIRIGNSTNVQDLCVLHADPGFPCTLGDRVTLGHGAIVHGATVEDECMIGMRAVVMNGAVIGKGSLIGVGAVVTEGKKIPPNSVVMGVPGRVIRSTTDDDRQRINHAADHYVEAGRRERGARA